MILSTLLILASSVPAVSPTSLEDMPEVGVPFACGRIHTVSQGHDTGSHKHNDTYAWDFRMPEGTPIVASTDGLVRMARGDSTEGGCDEKFASKANYVVISHGNGLESQYLHFSAVVVKAGERVKRGQLIGFSGSTGWSCGPHLHFKVARSTGRGWNNPSVPARILGYGDPVRDTRVAAPVCRESQDNMVASREGTRNVGQPMVSLSTGADEAQQTARGLPPGAKAVLDSLSQPPALGGEGQRKPAPARPLSGTASARETR
jgi:murein DD-endopeptidase MepM/ murein hydrolase activator NlpD